VGLVLVDAGLPSVADGPFHAEALDIRLDVQQRRPVEDVDVADVKCSAFSPSQANYAEADRVRPGRGARGKYSSRMIFEKGDHGQVWRLGAMEVEQKDDVREAFQIAKAFFMGGIDFDRALDAPGIAGLDRRLRGVDVRRVDHTDWAVFDRLVPRSHDDVSIGECLAGCNFVTVWAETNSTLIHITPITWRAPGNRGHIPHFLLPQSLTRKWGMCPWNGSRLPPVRMKVRRKIVGELLRV